MKEQPERPIFGPEDPRLNPPNPPEIRPARSILKAISWRVLGTLDTLVLSFVILSFLGPFFGLEEVSSSVRAKTAVYIALTEVATKLTLYFCMNGSGRGCSGTETWTRKDTTGTVDGARSPRRRHIGSWQV